MKRFVLAASSLFVCAVALTTPVRAATAAQHYAVIGTYSRPQSVIQVFGVSSFDPTTQSGTDYGCVTVVSGSSSDSGCGPLHANLGPSATAGTLTGTVQGSSAPITVNLVFAAASAETNPLPYAAAWVAPTDPPFVQVSTSARRYGFVTGSVTSVFGTMQVTEIAEGVEGLGITSA